MKTIKMSGMLMGALMLGAFAGIGFGGCAGNDKVYETGKEFYEKGKAVYEISGIKIDEVESIHEVAKKYDEVRADVRAKQDSNSSEE